LDNAKKNSAVFAADFVKQGMTIGVGSGSTVYWLIEELGRRVRQGLQIVAVPTSSVTAEQAKQAGIALSELNAVEEIPLTIDGADEIDEKGNLIKGGGGALLQEKIVASASRELIIIADSSKLVHRLGKFPLPVEVVPFGYRHVERQILNSGSCRRTTVRTRGENIFVSDHSNYILDCDYGQIEDAAALNTALHLIPGVVETGLFVNMASKAIIGWDDGRVEVLSYR